MKNAHPQLVVPNRRRVPKCWRGDLESVLIGRAELNRRTRELAKSIEADFSGRNLVVVALLTGTVLFLADLIRELRLPLHLDFIGVSSYGAGTRAGRLIFNKELRLDVRGRDVLIVDDILDTGRTLHAVIEKLRLLKPRRVKVCVLLEKRARRARNVRADYVGFLVPDLFVVGYGFDFAERYRNLPFIGVLRPEMLVPKSAGAN
ncbi:MAG: hypoxanthine phosphoribosyltransferase [Verrucomicrobia bacterium]|nr:hypoxanthine phosphoribosyltransferase [Verrucomicrobiota bacterium]